MKPKVALTQSSNRSQNINMALQLIEDDVDFKDKTNLFIKVNFVSTKNQLAATHVDAVRGLLQFIREHYNGKVTIGESTLGPARDGFERFGYLGLVKEFGVKGYPTMFIIYDVDEDGYIFQKFRKWYSPIGYYCTIYFFY